MTITSRLTSRSNLSNRLTALLPSFVLLASWAVAQNVTTNAGSPDVASVAVSGGTGNPTQVYSSAYIDASASTLSTGNDFCQTLATALAQLQGGTSGSYAGGAAVIDARGVNPSTSSFTCSTKTPLNPWSGISVPSTVLLPAGTIVINASWILPSGTRLVGEGGEDPALGGNFSRTIIQANSSVNFTPVQGETTTSGMIEMGTGSGTCNGVSIEDLVVSGNGVSGLNGINNVSCGDQSYVSRVTLYEISSVGLDAYDASLADNVASPVSYSGPYTNITFDTGGIATTDKTYGAYINQTTRGIQGMTCTTGNYTSTKSNNGYCIYLAGAGNTVEDVRIEGFTNGVTVLDSNEVLMNIDGDTNPYSGSTTLNVASISGGTNIVLIGISNNCSGTLCTDTSDYTVDDKVSGNTLAVTNNPFVAMYVLGSKIKLATTPGTTYGYSLYTTSAGSSTSTSTVQSPANWSVGSGAPSSACAAGSLYSNTTSASGVAALWVCSANSSYFGDWKSVE